MYAIFLDKYKVNNNINCQLFLNIPQLFHLLCAHLLFPPLPPFPPPLP